MFLNLLFLPISLSLFSPHLSWCMHTQTQSLSFFFFLPFLSSFFSLCYLIISVSLSIHFTESPYLLHISLMPSLGWDLRDVVSVDYVWANHVQELSECMNEPKGKRNRVCSHGRKTDGIWHDILVWVKCWPSNLGENSAFLYLCKISSGHNMASLYCNVLWVVWNIYFTGLKSLFSALCLCNIPVLQSEDGLHKMP